VNAHLTSSHGSVDALAAGISIRLVTTLPADTLLLSQSELMCLPNAPASRFRNAERDGTLKPLGVVGRAAIYAITLEEVERLKTTLARDSGSARRR
jgi:hypothetical protein